MKCFILAPEGSALPSVLDQAGWEIVAEIIGDKIRWRGKKEFKRFDPPIDLQEELDIFAATADFAFVTIPGRKERENSVAFFLQKQVRVIATQCGGGSLVPNSEEEAKAMLAEVNRLEGVSSGGARHAVVFTTPS